MKTRVEDFYDRSPQYEWDRMDRHPMEFRTTLRAMREFIRPKSRLLDNGGGPGRYSIELAKDGHRVTLLDLSSGNIELARVKAQEVGVELDDFIHGNALDLSTFEDAWFDTVLLMGPLYHLTEPLDRDRAIRESLRVLRPGGLFFASFITRYAVYFDLLKSDAGLIEKYKDAYDRLMQGGVHIPTQQNPGFTDAYFAPPMEIEPLMLRHNLTTVRLAIAEGLVASVEPAINCLPPEQFDAWADICYRLGTDPTIWGCGEHMLYVGRKRMRPSPVTLPVRSGKVRGSLSRDELYRDKGLS